MWNDGNVSHDERTDGLSCRGVDLRVCELGVGGTGVYIVGFGEKLRLVLNRRSSFETTKPSTTVAIEIIIKRTVGMRRNRKDVMVCLIEYFLDATFLLCVCISIDYHVRNLARVTPRVV